MIVDQEITSISSLIEAFYIPCIKKCPEVLEENSKVNENESRVKEQSRMKISVIESNYFEQSPTVV